MRPGNSSEAVTVALPARLDIQAASDLKRALMPFELEPATVELDGSAVEAADTAGLQLLLALISGRRAAQRNVRWRARSDALAQAVAQLGLGDALEMTVGAEAPPTSSGRG